MSMPVSITATMTPAPLPGHGAVGGTFHGTRISATVPSSPKRTAGSLAIRTTLGTAARRSTSRRKIWPDTTPPWSNPVSRPAALSGARSPVWVTMTAARRASTSAVFSSG